MKIDTAAKSLQSCPTLCDPIDGSHQAPPSLGFSRQEHWSGLPFPSPMHERKSESEVTQSCSTLSDPMDCSPPGSSVHEIFQARVLEWGAIAFSTETSLLLLLSHFSHVIANGRISFFKVAMAPHSSTLAWKIPWMEEPGRLQSMGSQRVRHD